MCVCVCVCVCVCARACARTFVRVLHGYLCSCLHICYHLLWPERILIQLLPSGRDQGPIPKARDKMFKSTLYWSALAHGGQCRQNNWQHFVLLKKWSRIQGSAFHNLFIWFCQFNSFPSIIRHWLVYTAAAHSAHSAVTIPREPGQVRVAPDQSR